MNYRKCICNLIFYLFDSFKVKNSLFNETISHEKENETNGTSVEIFERHQSCLILDDLEENFFNDE